METLSVNVCLTMSPCLTQSLAVRRSLTLVTPHPVDPMLSVYLQEILPHAGVQQVTKEIPSDPARRGSVSMTENVLHIWHASTSTVGIHVSQEHVGQVLTVGFKTTDLSVLVLKVTEGTLSSLVRGKSLLVDVTANQLLLRPGTRL